MDPVAVHVNKGQKGEMVSEARASRESWALVFGKLLRLRSGLCCPLRLTTAIFMPVSKRPESTETIGGLLI